MVQDVITRKEDMIFQKEILKELKEIKANLKFFLQLIPIESISAYEEPVKIEKAFAQALKEYPVE